MANSMSTAKLTELNSENINLTDPKFIELNQTFVCFDLESENDATQQIEIRRVVSENIAWRIRTNAPTRYIVNPNSGVLSNEITSTKIMIQLVENNYHPNHEIIVQAIRGSNKDVWASENAKMAEQVQTIPLQLSTTIVNFDDFSVDSQAQQASLAKIFSRNASDRNQQERELSEMLRLLHSDCEAIENNIKKAGRLKEMIGKNLHDKHKELKSLKMECEMKDFELLKLKQKMAEMPNCCVS